MHSLTSTHAHSHVHMRTHARARFSAGGGKPGGRGSVPRPRSVGQLGRLGEETEGALFDAAGGRRGREVAGRGRGGRGEAEGALHGRGVAAPQGAAQAHAGEGGEGRGDREEFGGGSLVRRACFYCVFDACFS